MNLGRTVIKGKYSILKWGSYDKTKIKFIINAGTKIKKENATLRLCLEEMSI